MLLKILQYDVRLFQKVTDLMIRKEQLDFYAFSHSLPP